MSKLHCVQTKVLLLRKIPLHWEVVKKCTPVWWRSHYPAHWWVWGNQLTVESTPAEDCGHRIVDSSFYIQILLYMMNLKQTKKSLHTLKKGFQHSHLSLLFSHSSCASRRILSSSPCRVEEMVSCGPVRLSLRLTAAISSSSSTQEPDEENKKTCDVIQTMALKTVFY